MSDLLDRAYGPYSEVAAKDITYFGTVIGADYVLSRIDDRRRYGRDETEDLEYPPEVVLRPSEVDEVQDIMRYCHQHRIAVTPIGARTGLSGGALSVHGGVGLSMERFDRILDIDEDNHQATVEPGVITEVFQNAVKEKGLFYPPDPASRGTCSIGGNLAENSGGPKAVKYGVTKDHVLNLEVVLADGEVIWTGADTLKNSTGYNITQLMVGSEGTLGVITKAVFKLLPHPTADMLMLVPFDDPLDACRAVSAIFKAGVIPSGLEFMERDALLWAIDFIGEGMDIPESVQAHLLIEVDGHDMDLLMAQCEKIAEVVQANGCGEILLADSAAQKDELWKLRRRVGEAVKARSVYKEEDTVVPRYHLPELLATVKEVGERYGFKSVCYGHAGDGNLHVNIIKGDLDEERWQQTVTEGIREIFAKVVALRGTISGEHGIGLVQRPYMDIRFSALEMELFSRLKSAFDPAGILNPGKIF